MKIKNAAIFLMISSIYSILFRIYDFIDSVTDKNRLEYFKEHIIFNLTGSLSIIVSVSLFVLSIALLKNNDAKISKNEVSLPIQNEKQPISVGDWLVNFLITIIPLVGLIFMILWANDDKNKSRKNWAIASLIWTGIIFVLSIFLYLTIFAVIMKKLYN